MDGNAAGLRVSIRHLSQVTLGAVLATWFALAPLLLAQSQPANTHEPWMDLPASSTGINVGEKVPGFRLPDQFGRMQDLNSIRGPKGTAIFFIRSADW